MMITEKMIEAAHAEPVGFGVFTKNKGQAEYRFSNLVSDTAEDANELGREYFTDRFIVKPLYIAPPAPSVAVKALEWDLRSYNSGRHSQYIARSIVGNYAITDLSVLGWFEWLNRSCGPVGKTNTLEQAKAAAQADYEARIRTALL